MDTRNGNAALLGLGLFSCLQFRDWLTWKIQPRASSRVINYYPRYLNDPKSLVAIYKGEEEEAGRGKTFNVPFQGGARGRCRCAILQN
jgi:hypothetical protein